MTFLIQTVGNRIVHDFAFDLIESINYQNWYAGIPKFSYQQCELNQIKDMPELHPIDDWGNYTPVGTLEFVFEFMDKILHLPPPKPINIPTELKTETFLKRKVGFMSIPEESPAPAKLFIKSASAYKKFTDVTSSNTKIPADLYFISEEIEIDSEWRAFVWHKKLVGLQHYLGEFTLFPDVPLIQQMVDTYNDCPPAYTLDVGINKQGTFVIEVHPLVSCGLYGFNDHKILPQMMIAAFYYFKEVANAGNKSV